MSAFGLLRNGLALVAGAALLDVIFEEMGDKPTYTETDSEKNYRESCEKMAELQVKAAEAKTAEAEEKVAKRNMEIAKLQAEMRELMEKVETLRMEAVAEQTEEPETEPSKTEETGFSKFFNHIEGIEKSEEN